MLKIILISLIARGVVGLSGIYIRQAPDYESSLETQELMGTPVEILGSDRYWRKISVPQPYEGWATSKGIVPMDSTVFEAYLAAPKYICTAKTGSVMESPSSAAKQFCDLVAGDVLRVLESSQGSVVRKGPFRGVVLPDGRKGWVRKECLERMDEWEKGNNEMPVKERLAKIIDFAVSLRGVPYLWGGMTVYGMDCSGLARLSFLMGGIPLPRNASQQIGCGRAIGIDDMEAWKAGDLVFFGNKTTGRATHVGIYIGEGRFVHSSMCVRVNSLRDGDSDRYENAHRLIAVRRILE